MQRGAVKQIIQCRPPVGAVKGVETTGGKEVLSEAQFLLNLGAARFRRKWTVWAEVRK